MRNDLDILYKVKQDELTTKSSSFCQNHIASGKYHHATARAGKPNRIESVNICIYNNSDLFCIMCFFKGDKSGRLGKLFHQQSNQIVIG